MSMPGTPRGFARWSPEKRREVASRGGTAAVTRHRWTPAEARIAGRAGGLARAAIATRTRLEAPGKGKGAPQG
jgi:hypothetical protein